MRTNVNLLPYHKPEMTGVQSEGARAGGEDGVPAGAAAGLFYRSGNSRQGGGETRAQQAGKFLRCEVIITTQSIPLQLLHTYILCLQLQRVG